MKKVCLLLLSLTIFSCSDGREITGYSLIAESQLNWNSDFSGKNGLNYYVINSSDKLNIMFNFESSRANKELLEEILKKNDLLVSLFPVAKVLTNTEFTKKDGCDYMKATPIEIILNTNNNNNNNTFYIYKIEPKGKYRIICP